VFERLDASQDWVFLRYLDAALDVPGHLDALFERIVGDRPIGPSSPVPWALSAEDAARWSAERRSRLSELGDPIAADAAWLPWLAQLVGAQLDPQASESEQRDTIRYITSGWRAGTRLAIEDAARSTLTGTRYARLQPHYRPDAGTPTMWDATIITRVDETPDPATVLGVVLRKGVKPAGMVLWHQTYEATWDVLEAERSTWDDWSDTWQKIEETGL
jgi:hypothetical protein